MHEEKHCVTRTSCGAWRPVARLPFLRITRTRVRELYLDSVQAALRAMPTGYYHAALIDQIFLAEFRHDIETTPVLTEHNID